METGEGYRLLADTILVVHVLFVAFVICALLLVYLGGLLDWRWVRNPWLRILHLAAVAVVVLQSWLGLICPLTIWEMSLRAKAGDRVYEGSFISHWLRELLYYEAPLWVFAVVYTVFGILVAASWLLVRPRPFGAVDRREKY